MYIDLVFVGTIFLTLWLLYKATGFSKSVMLVTLAWLVLQAFVALSGFYTVTTGGPPRFALLVLPPVVFIVMLFIARGGRRFVDGLDGRLLTLLHVLRIPAELTLYWLYLHKVVPRAMTFEGRNFDILSGLTAPLVWYFGFVKPRLGKGVLIGWNIVCLLLLVNIAVTAVLSGSPYWQRFGFEQRNIALFYFPFVWLPCCMVPIVLLAHLVAIRQLARGVLRLGELKTSRCTKIPGVRGERHAAGAND
jgi:hypothetical protein